MHTKVWVITDIEYRPDAFRQTKLRSREITAHFDESAIQARNDPWGQPAIKWDHIATGWGDEGPDETFMRASAAAARDIGEFPRTLVAPNGYTITGKDAEDKALMRSILENWPANGVVAEDWHY